MGSISEEREESFVERLEYDDVLLPLSQMNMNAINVNMVTGVNNMSGMNNMTNLNGNNLTNLNGNNLNGMTTVSTSTVTGMMNSLGPGVNPSAGTAELAHDDAPDTCSSVSVIGAYPPEGYAQIQVPGAADPSLYFLPSSGVGPHTPSHALTQGCPKGPSARTRDSGTSRRAFGSLLVPDFP